MSYGASLYKISKRKNSTAVPSTSPRSVTIDLKQGSSILSPIFNINIDSDDYNYMLFNGRYYWITNWRWMRENYAEISCECDALASWKSNIMGTTAYVMYSSSSYDAYLSDNRLLTSQNTEVNSWTGDDILIFDFSAGRYVTGIVGKQSARGQTNGLTQVFALTQSQCSDLSNSFGDGDLAEQITQQFGSAWQCLLFCKWMPFRFQTSGGGTIMLGSVNSGISGEIITQRYVQTTFQVVVPQYSSDFRSVEPYSAAYLYLPYVGIVKVELSVIRQLGTHLLVNVVGDTYTGDLVYQIGGMSNPLAVYSGNCAVEIPLSYYQRDAKGVVQGGVNTMINILGTAINSGKAAAVTAVTGGAGGLTAGQSAGAAAAGGVTGVLSSAASTAMSYFTFNTGTIGGFSGGCGSALGLAPKMVVVTHPTSQAPSNMSGVLGRPCGKTLSMSGLSGYVQCADFNVSGEMMLPEKEAIDNAMIGGVYIE